MPAQSLATIPPPDTRLTRNGFLGVRRFYAGETRNYLFCLGHRYEVDRDGNPLVPNEVDNTYLSLQAIKRYVDRRATYMCWLDAAIDRALNSDPDMHRFLAAERNYWRQLDLLDMDRAFQGRLRLPVEVMLQDKDTCWLWDAPIHPQERPAINWHYSKGVHVIRILWPYIDARNMLPWRRGQRKHPVPLPSYDTAGHRNCVNPTHYFLTPGKKALKPAHPVGRGGRSDIRTGRNVGWYVGTNSLLFCYSNHLLGPDVQDEWAKTGELKKRPDCGDCKKIYRNVHADEASYSGRKAVRDEDKGLVLLQEGFAVEREMLKPEHFHPEMQGSMLPAEAVDDGPPPPNPDGSMSLAQLEWAVRQDSGKM